MVIPQSNFRDEEYEIPREIFIKSGFEIRTVGERRGESIGKYGTKAWIDFPFAEVNTHNFEAVVFVGGQGAAHFLADDEALNLARKFHEEGKLVAAICIAPSILANAGILQGKKATVCKGEEANLGKHVATYTSNPVEVDDGIITANGPEAAEEFAEKIVDFLG